jgi:hypothetical protein
MKLISSSFLQPILAGREKTFHEKNRRANIFFVGLARAILCLVSLCTCSGQKAPQSPLERLLNHRRLAGRGGQQVQGEYRFGNSARAWRHVLPGLATCS